jgi:hypothetical protein
MAASHGTSRARHYTLPIGCTGFSLNERWSASDVPLHLAGLDLSTEVLPLPWYPIDRHINKKFLLGPFTLRSTLVSRIVLDIRPNFGFFQGVLQPVPPGLPPSLPFVHSVPIVCSGVETFAAVVDMIRQWADFSAILTQVIWILVTLKTDPAFDVYLTNA